MIDIGVPLEIVSKFLRHKDIATTQRWYADIRDEDVMRNRGATRSTASRSRSMIGPTTRASPRRRSSTG